MRLRETAFRSMDESPGLVATTSVLDGTIFGPGQPCFGCGPDHPIGFHLAFTIEGDEVVTQFTPGPQYQGPKNIMHGGLVATLADEVADWALIALKEKFGFTAEFSVKLKKPIRIGVPLEARGKIVADRRRIIDVQVRILQSGDEAFTGDFKFVVLDKTGAEKMIGGPMPEAWAKFCR